MQHLYSFTFEIVSFDLEQLEALEDQFDVVAADGHGLTELSVVVEGDTLEVAYELARQEIGKVGICIKRYMPELVGRREIADRAGVTQQAVGNYIRGDRGSDFPGPYFPVAQGVWLWGEVLPWLQAQSGSIVDECTYPDRAQTESLGHRHWSDSTVDGASRIPNDRAEPSNWGQMVTTRAIAVSDTRMSSWLSVYRFRDLDSEVWFAQSKDQRFSKPVTEEQH